MRAMILAAGLGTRMRPLTNHCPKPLLKVAGKPLIEHQIERLVKAGVKEIVVNHAYLGHQIEDFVDDGTKWGAHVQFSAEPADEPLETGGGIFKALSLVSPDGEPFVVVNGDIWIDLDYSTLVDKNLDGLIHLVMVKNPEHNPSGDFQLDDQHNLHKDGENKFTFSGVSIIDPKLFVDCEAGAFKLAPLFKEAMDQQSASGELYNGYWLDVGTPERLNELESHLKKRM